jgi:DNA/RNA-binding domain of Phe-tRNA-synthetase-like protein
MFTRRGVSYMTKIHIHPSLSAAAPDLKLGVLTATVQNTEHTPTLWERITEQIASMEAELEVAQVNSLPPIAAQRSAYKALGKDPSRYRGSSEALLRRVLQGKGLYQVNTVVDINNLISLKTLHPVGTYDLARIEGPVEFRVGETGESYKRIGKAEINIESLPVLCDQHGPFGSPTSDSERAMIGMDTTQIMMVVMSFGGGELAEAMEEAERLLVEYVAGVKIHK